MIFLLPTDTCYGLAGALTREDYEEIYRLKWRDFSKQLAILVRDFSDLQDYIDISDTQIAHLERYPYPWSFLWRRKPSFALPDFMDPLAYTHISLRVAESCIDSHIRDKIAYPLFLTSANLTGERESTTLKWAERVFPWLTWYDGEICDRPPSDIFSLGEGGEIVYLRKNYS